MKKPLSNSYISALCTELSLTMQAGIPAEEGLSILLEEEQDPKIAAELSKVHQTLAGGAPLYQALAASVRFPPYLVEMVEIGEKTGNLDRVLQTLSQHYDRQAETARSIKSAVVYPAVLLCMMLAVVIILITLVLPIFEDVYRQLGTAMTGAAAAILRLGTAVANHWAVIVLVFAALAAAAAIALHAEPSRKWLRSKLGSRRLKQLILEERFASSMAMTIASGFDVDDALAMSAKLCGDEKMAGKIAACREQMASGTAFSEAVSNCGILKGLSARTLGVGVRTGTADTVLSELAEQTQRRVLDETENIIGRIEPTLVIVMSVLVGGILLAVMLPLMGILSTLG